MQESVRLQYLGLLGIEQWLQRDDPSTAGAANEASPETAATTAESATTAPRDADTRTPTGVAASPGTGKTVETHTEGASTASGSTTRNTPPTDPDLPAQLARMKAAAGNTRPSAVNDSRNRPEPPPGRTPTPAVRGTRFGCAILHYADGLLIVAAYRDPAAPGLESAEHELMLSLAGRLAPEHDLANPEEISWPPRGNRVPGLDAPGEGERALVEMLHRYRRQGARDVIVLGEALAPLVGWASAKADLPAPLVTHSLAAMIDDPSLRKGCWSVLQSLARSAPK